MRTAVFDLDGTLADTSADLIAAANAALAHGGHGVELDPLSDAKIAFAGGRAMLTAGLTRLEHPEMAGQVETLYPVLLDAYRDKISVHTRLYDGVEGTLDALEARGWILAVCTNKPEALALDLLERLGLGQRFRAMLGADTLPVRKPDPTHLLETVARAGGRREASVLIGDTVTDRETARRAEVPCVLVGFGPEGRAVADLNPEAIVDSYSELPDVLEGLVPAARRSA
ncbi:HAD hydrolase-like protein [Amaricoccus tamworthensis]|uniref:HAD hydrolase-like protein n=1 Tax=Amaricoccus tamworthensis TaxID=57002 RepID=UPI003C7CF4A9